LLPYTVTADTVLEFDFQSGSQGEIHGIGLDDDNAYSEDRTFKLYGTQDWGLTEHDDYAATAPGVRHYRIEVGAHYTGAMTGLFFVMDHDDAPTPAGESVFSNIRLYEAGAHQPGDANGDGVVNIDDLVLVTGHYGQSMGDPAWDPLADLNGDAVVSVEDLTEVTSNFGKTYP
jgi:hypothetical protein